MRSGGEELAPGPGRALALGGLVFAAGVALAAAWLPEWHAGKLPERELFVRRFHALARQAGVALELEAPAVFLATADDETRLAGAALARLHDASLASQKRSPEVKVVQHGTLRDDPTVRELQIAFSPTGEPRGLIWEANRWNVNVKLVLANRAQVAAFARLLLAPGETLGEGLRLEVSNSQFAVYPVVGRHREHLFEITPYGGTVHLRRRAGDPADGIAEAKRYDLLALMLRGSRNFGLFLTVAVLFVVLLIKRRIDLWNGAVLAGCVFVVSAPTFVLRDPTAFGALNALLASLSKTIWVLLIWSAAESYLRATEPGFSTSLDALRLGRLGPRAGRALLFGLAAGAAAAGAALALYAAAALPGCWPEATSLDLPAFTISGSPLASGISLAATLTLLLGFARRLLPAGRAAAAAVVAGVALLPVMGLHPLPLKLAANAIVLGLLVAAARRFGLTALFTAALVFYLLPLAVFAGLHLAWLPATFGITAGLTAAIALAGAAGLRRPAQAELEGLKPPAFIRRLEDERRLKYEMDLLARMQLGLLPQQLPRLPGWDLAARSLLATEAGGDLYDFLLDDEGKLWVAAGDVAGHGYSCAIVQAMTTAALTSLIASGRKPSEVLLEVDRVIRRGGAPRNFTSLALLHLDPATGDALLANAGHPFPFIVLVGGGDVAEVDLPGLPLGQGPARDYADEPLHLSPGSILIFCSDGLFEALDWNENPYGYDRPRVVLQAARARTAAELLEALLADWRRHLGRAAPPDDATVVVIKRAPAAPAGSRAAPG